MAWKLVRTGASEPKPKPKPEPPEPEPEPGTLLHGVPKVHGVPKEERARFCAGCRARPGDSYSPGAGVWPSHRLVMGSVSHRFHEDR
jgi:hypothetical protein